MDESINQSHLFCLKNRNNNVTECRLEGLRSDLPLYESSSYVTFDSYDLLTISACFKFKVTLNLTELIFLQ